MEAIAKALHIMGVLSGRCVAALKTLGNEIVGITSCQSVVGGEEAAHRRPLRGMPLPLWRA